MIKPIDKGFSSAVKRTLTSAVKTRDIRVPYLGGKRWSRVADCCQSCGTRTRKHASKGYCTNCLRWIKKQLNKDKPKKVKEIPGYAFIRRIE